MRLTRFKVFSQTLIEFSIRSRKTGSVANKFARGIQIRSYGHR